MNEISKFWKEPIAGYNPWINSVEFTFDVIVAERVCKFFETQFKHSKGEYAGKNFILEDWQKKILGHLFGWKRKDGTRRYRKLFLLIPRKNGKSFICSALALIMLCADNEPGSEVYLLAANTNQASLIFKESCNMVNQNKLLSNEIEICPSAKGLKFPKTVSYMKVLSSEALSQHGLNPHCFIIDEVHTQRKDELIEVMQTATGSRRQPLEVYISTADYAGDSPCNRMVAYARKVRDNQIEDSSYMPILYELTCEDDWTDEKNWYKANPNLGVSIKVDFFKSQYRKAREEPSFENTFKRLHLNIQTEQERRWLKIEDWDNSGQKIDKEELKGKKCFAGIDLSSTRDITALVLYFPEYYACLPFFWVPEFTATKKLEYKMWNKQEYCYLTQGNVVNYEEIRQKVLELKEIYDINSIAYDPWNAAQFATNLSDNDGVTMIQFRQGYMSLNEPSKELEKILIEKKLVHFNNPIMRWMASNVQVKDDPAGNIKPIKANKDSPQKIDGIVALIMALGISMQAREERSMFDDPNFDIGKIYGDNK